MSAPSPGLPRFAVTVYQIAGAPTASLLLQDRCGVDVNVLLYAAFVGAVRGGSLDAEDVAHAIGRVGAWQTEVVGPLRTLRRRLKAGPAPAPTSATDALRQRVKALELDAELLELHELSALADGFVVTTSTGSPSERAAAAMNVVVCCAAGRGPDAEERGAIETIAAAAARYREGVG